ncbi:RHS repeat-associated core domain-containing protein [Cysteiniphilum halobium]|uniref:RHS repeat-associated core domain-containing protein n=1 Tax=Cysteiniphilum halobium TaxID=2219059 RepID=UPI000E64F6EB|nr:RHS repeat-associated core domain-containing protein [Cysteiniphilum halobium]
MLNNKVKLCIAIGVSCLFITQSIAYSLDGIKAMNKQSIHHQSVLVETAINYNTNGNMSMDNKGASFSYNAANALTQVSLASGAKESDYYYANGLRAVAQSNTQVLVHYYSQHNQLLNTSNGAHSSAYLIANNVTVRSVMGDATVLLHNRHGSVIAHLGDNKSQFYQYSVYGVQKTEDKGQKTENKNGSLALATNPLRYSGYMFDPLTGLYYLKARDYDPSLRNFIQADSYAFNNNGLINGYFYGNNNPLMGVDPSGHVFEDFMINSEDIFFPQLMEEVPSEIPQYEIMPAAADYQDSTFSEIIKYRGINKQFKAYFDKYVARLTNNKFQSVSDLIIAVPKKLRAIVKDYRTQNISRDDFEWRTLTPWEEINDSGSDMNNVSRFNMNNAMDYYFKESAEDQEKITSNIDNEQGRLERLHKQRLFIQCLCITYFVTSVVLVLISAALPIYYVTFLQ